MSTRLSEIAVNDDTLTLEHVVTHYPAESELDRLLRGHVPEIVFLSFESMPLAMGVASKIAQILPNAHVVGVEKACEQKALLELMRVGVRDFLHYPFDPLSLNQTVGRLKDILDTKPVRVQSTDEVNTFLPAKAGCGTSTIALNLAETLAAQPETNVLLMDLDLNSGLLGFMLKLDTQASIYDAAEQAGKLDEKTWPDLVTSIRNLDVIPSGRIDPRNRIEPLQIRQILTFARRIYKVICLDLSGNMEKYSLEVMQESKRVFVVVTPEMPSLHLARKKIQLLHNMDLSDRIHVLLNRSHSQAVVSSSQVEELLGVTVHIEFPNDYRGVHAALKNGKAVARDSELGRQFSKLAGRILQRPVEPKRGLLDYLAFGNKVPVS